MLYCRQCDVVIDNTLSQGTWPGNLAWDRHGAYEADMEAVGGGRMGFRG